MLKFSILFISIILFACNSKSQLQNQQKAKQLYSEGMKFLNKRISLQSSDNKTAFEINKMAIEKFTSAYNLDTTFTDAVLFASECTMYGKDYRQCVYWTTKLMRLDTSQQNIKFCNKRIRYCQEEIAVIR